jgi:hypothetical protein
MQVNTSKTLKSADSSNLKHNNKRSVQKPGRYFS